MSTSFVASAIKNSTLKNVVARNYATPAAAAVKHINFSVAGLQPEISTLNNGALIISVENYAPISNVAIFVKSGSRFESSANKGMSHMVRLCAGLRTEKYTAFTITRSSEFMGAEIDCKNGREHIRYDMSMNRDLLKEGFSLLSSIAVDPSFMPHEIDAHPLPHMENLPVQSFNNRIRSDLASADPITLTMELLHKAAFRNSGLGNSLLMPEYKVGKIEAEELHKFHDGTHRSQRMAIVGLGVRHSDLVNRAKKLELLSGDGVTSEPSKYFGSEIRNDVNSPLTYIAVAGPGASIGSEHAASLEIAQSILGTTPGTKYGSNSTNKLYAALRGAGGSGCASAFNINYSDTGLFGFYLIEEGSKANNVTKAVAKVIRNLKVSETDVKQAVVRAKSAFLMGIERSDKMLEHMGLQAILTRNYVSPSEYVAALDKVTAPSVQDALAVMLKGKPSMAVYGDLSNAPYVDEL